VSRFSRISRVPVTGSTNDDISRMLGEEQARGLTLVADYQEHGKGRKGRTWIAPPGSALLCTIGLPDPVSAADLWAVPFWTALVVAGAMRDCGAKPVITWPNDVLIGDRKAAGILCISRVLGDYAWVGCGIGINVTRPKDDAALAEVTPAPAFLSDVTRADRETLLQAVLRQADARYDDLYALSNVVREWEFEARIPGVRYRISLDTESEPFEATVLRLLEGGSLLVDRDGTQQEITLADARILRE
jgi:BirA family transcriptional regulator, biotin operon repressor / biotin---[acetyl-CoA-carboxylase] ligase